ncbi:MAG: oxidoreductase [Chitinophagaceae bacterium]|nr:oxidoreductase [Chitinophagaceae bacterium]
MKAGFSVIIALLILTSLAYAQLGVEILTSGTNSSLRGLSVVNDHVIWVSGSNGTIGKSLNGGKNWKWTTVKGFEKNDFRDIEAFDATTAVIMAVGEPAYILRTVNGGENWKVVFEDKTPGMFLDAIEFWNEKAGIVLGDPVNGKFFIARTFDGGSTWEKVPDKYLPAAVEGEACFAASGTNIRALDRDEAVFVTGGTKSRMFWKGDPIDLPILQGKETTGANSIAVWDNYRRNGGNQIIVVGGDFANDTLTTNNCFYSNNRGRTWHIPDTPPNGYRSCVEFFSKKDVVACGLTGVDYSHDGGRNWSPISDESFHVVRFAKGGLTMFLAGANGKIGKLVLK